MHRERREAVEVGVAGVLDLARGGDELAGRVELGEDAVQLAALGVAVAVAVTMTVSPALLVVIFGAGGVAGMLGAVLGLGGGVFLVPFLNLGLQFPIGTAAAISLTTVIGTSSSISARRAGQDLINLRLGMVLSAKGGQVVRAEPFEAVELSVDELFGADPEDD